MIDESQLAKDLASHTANAGPRGSDLALLTGLALLHDVVILDVDVSRNPQCRSPPLELLGAHVVVLEMQLVKLHIMLKLGVDALQDKRKIGLDLRVFLVHRLRQSRRFCWRSGQRRCFLRTAGWLRGLGRNL